MSTLCPECGEPPHYHSFCTLCAKLFWSSERRWKRRRAKAERDKAFIEAYHRCASTAQLAAVYGKKRDWAYYHQIRLKLPCYPRKVSDYKTPSSWLPEHDAELAAAIAEGLTGRQAAARLGRPYTTVCNRRLDLGLPQFKRPPRYNKGRRHPLADTVGELRRANLSFSQIGAKLRISRSAVSGIIGRHLRREDAHA